ncbi:MAG: RNA methyltransferase [Parvibaculum sp.]|uniref:TrmH family RNA methyltransferase n=1 Tax=Parvibaculum sp. TaxID=2024848 RepID=UPI00284D5762|nr:RNA methyltransferase [Parvibaculum sp.]MDR3498209.1 RNA methyltransferase [Parvibaculum sp.]
MSGDIWRVIESPQNPRAKLWADILDGRGIKRHGEFLLAGRKSVPEALARHGGRFHALIAADPGEAAGLALPDHIDRFRVTRSLFDRLDVSGTGFPLLVGKVPEMTTADLAAPPVGIELIVALGDPANLGALFRSAAAFGARRIVLMEEAAHPFHPKALRAAANAQFELELMRGPSWAALDAAQGPIFALDAGGEDMGAFVWPKALRLVLGEEGKGLPAGLKVKRLAVPMTGAVESLNATVAASLALFSHFLASR